MGLFVFFSPVCQLRDTQESSPAACSTQLGLMTLMAGGFLVVVAAVAVVAVDVVPIVTTSSRLNLGLGPTWGCRSSAAGGGCHTSLEFWTGAIRSCAPAAAGAIV